ncbi:MAG TPA: M56 family metallopeptidase, partial [Chthoniobacteraceae bacterium]|nr:M56 family metallopeptidase [Chthoniobacteraceae bacterium]
MNTSLLVALAERIGWTLLHSLWQGAVVALVLALVLRLLRGGSAAARHAASMLALLAFTALVVGTACRVGAASPTAQVPEPRTAAAMDNDGPQIGRDTAPTANSTADTMDSPDVAASTIRSAATAPLRSAWRPRFEPLLPWMSAVWLVGVALLTLRHIAGWRRLRAMRRSGTPARGDLQESFVRLLERFGSTASVRLLESAEAAVPLLTGLCKPAILLPIRVITGLGEHEIEAILAHELAHLARRDAWSNFAQVAIETLFFYHPAVWWIGRRARLERENAADDLALKVCADRRVYVGALAHLAELRFGPQPALAATGGNLLARIQRIVRPAPVEPIASGWSLGIPALFIALGVAAIVHARAADTKTIEVAPGQSIQAAIDAAPAGAIIRLGAGEWKERIIISKPLTLRGEGWEKTRITIEEPPAQEIGKEYGELSAALQATTTADATDKASIELIRRARRPAIFTHSADGVNIRDLRVQGVSTLGSNSGLTVSTLVYFY